MWHVVASSRRRRLQKPPKATTNRRRCHLPENIKILPSNDDDCAFVRPSFVARGRPRGRGRHAAKVSGTAVYSRRVGRSSHVVETPVPFPKEHASTTAEHSSNILLRGRVANGEAPQNRSHLKNAESPRCVCVWRPWPRDVRDPSQGPQCSRRSRGTVAKSSSSGEGGGEDGTRDRRTVLTLND